MCRVVTQLGRSHSAPGCPQTAIRIRNSEFCEFDYQKITSLASRYNRIMGQARHIAIAGGGIIGLSCALVLRSRGLEITVLEAGEAAKEASWAAGGMLAAEDPENPPALLSLSRYSRSLYPEFLQEIEALSGQHVSLRTHETVQILREQMPEHAPTASTGVLLSREEARDLIPELGDTEDRYLLLKEASLDPRELCASLRSAVLAAGVQLREQERVVSARVEGESVLLTTEHRALQADALVNCCGAWAPSLDPSLEVVPRKGQMLVLAQPEGAPLLNRVLRSPEVYLIPRGDGRIVVGATVEDAGYSKQVEPKALALLRRRAARLWPPAASALQVDGWAGLRPGTADGLPVIGRYTDGNNLRFVAAGHFRNGILLAPGTAHAIADLVCGEMPAIELAPFAPHRASLSPACDNHFAAAL
jgi:glycine oxidase